MENENINFEPEQTPSYQSEPYRQAQPGYRENIGQYQPQYSPAPVKEKKGWTTGKVVALTVAVSLLCSALCTGFMMLGQYTGWGQIGKPTTGTNVLIGERENTVLDYHKVDTDKQMTVPEVYASNVQSTVGITTAVTTNYFGYQTTSAASGSGFILSDSGYILTNFHVIEGSSAITVTLFDGSGLDAKLVGYDESNDIAVLKVEGENLVPVVLGDSDNMNVGDTVVAIGNPLGELTFSLTTGVVSALNREVTLSSNTTMNLIQTDCAINSGNSGGALFNLYGEVIGITNAKYSGNSGSGASIDNIGFAIPVNQVQKIIKSIIEKGYVVKPYIGINVSDVSAETQSYGLPQGAAVRSVAEGGPAEKAGLQANDIITAINGKAVTSVADLKKVLAETEPGDVWQVVVYRRGTELPLEIQVGEQAQNQSQTHYPTQTYPWG